MSLVWGTQCYLVFQKDLELFTHPVVHASQMRILHETGLLVPVCISSASVLGLWDQGGNAWNYDNLCSFFHASIVCSLLSTCAQWWASHGACSSWEMAVVSQGLGTSLGSSAIFTEIRGWGRDQGGCVGVGEEHGTGAPMYVLWHQHLMSSFSRTQINTCIFKKSCVD